MGIINNSVVQPFGVGSVYDDCEVLLTDFFFSASLQAFSKTKLSRVMIRSFGIFVLLKVFYNREFTKQESGNYRNY